MVDLEKGIQIPDTINWHAVTTATGAQPYIIRSGALKSSITAHIIRRQVIRDLRDALPVTPSSPNDAYDTDLERPHYKVHVQTAPSGYYYIEVTGSSPNYFQEALHLQQPVPVVESDGLPPPAKPRQR